jgi:putative transposase
LLKLWAKPQKPTLAACLELLPSYYSGKQPSYTQAWSFIKKLGAVSREKGRMGSRDIKNIKGFIHRDSSDLMPADVYTADGHCFDAEVAHPLHGKPFRPEITAILDVATRKLVGWSVSLSESSWAVLDAIRMCATLHGIPAMFYVDNGSGYKNDVLTAQGRGVLSRLNITVSHALPYNSQGKGVIERSHKTLWVNAAKNLPTYIGKDMDAEAVKSSQNHTKGNW